ncbi:uncharacterized protein LOC131436967 [Malaya genurostris]|uniref:uncharacterized protein LOC131436967 n=1 Tax=Malaya genurostris TaxID=325434 RepID=UPI0026F3C68C|nr:uncharacterized protein LOC131436967 [Malaya genurostris]
MRAKFFQKCCRLCLDDTREQLEIRSVERLTQTLLELYNLKITNQDRCSQNICVLCYQDVSESQKWLDLLEKQKQVILANQQHFQEEVLEQLGPEPAPVVEENFSPTRSTRVTRRSARMGNEQTPKRSPIKNEPTQLRSGKRKLDWEPPSEQESETPTEATSNGDEADEEEAASDTTTTSSDTELKCNKCESVFSGIEALEKHFCEFICSVCSTALKHKWSLRRHLVDVHKIKATEWTNYWNPKEYGKDSQNLLVETTKPKKRYRYESDSPTDLEEDSSNEQAAEAGVEVTCDYCGDKFDSNQELKRHDCNVRCNICGFTFASRNNVKRHKIRVHKIDPSDPSLINNRARSVSRAASRPPSRPASRAASEHGSDDEPLAALASRSDDLNESEKSSGCKTPAKIKYRFFCTECDYSNLKRYRLVDHIVDKHGIPKDQIDSDAIPKQPSDGSKTPERPKTPATTPRSHTTPVYAPLPEPPKSPDLLVSMQVSHQPRGRSRSTYQDSIEYGQKRKRSLSACSNKSVNFSRSRSIPPPDREVLVAKRRLSTSNILAKVHPKLRTTLLGMEANRLHLAIRPGCELLPPNQQYRIRASSYINHEPCPMKKLFKLRVPVGIERERVHQMRELFRKMSHRVSVQSKVNSIDVESLVLDQVQSNSSSPLDALDQDPLNRTTPATAMVNCAASEQEGVIYEVREVDTQNVTTICGTSSNVIQVVEGPVSDQAHLPEQKKKKSKNKKEKRRRSLKESDVPDTLVQPKVENDIDGTEVTEIPIVEQDKSSEVGNTSELHPVGIIEPQDTPSEITCQPQSIVETESTDQSNQPEQLMDQQESAATEVGQTSTLNGHDSTQELQQKEMEQCETIVKQSDEEFILSTTLEENKLDEIAEENARGLDDEQEEQEDQDIVQMITPD